VQHRPHLAAIGCVALKGGSVDQEELLALSQHQDDFSAREQQSQGLFRVAGGEDLVPSQQRRSECSGARYSKTE